MSYAAILTHVVAEADAAPRLACAHAMAKRFNARLIGLGVEMIQPLAFDSGLNAVSADWAVAMRDSIEERLRTAETLFQTATADLPTDKKAWFSGLRMPGLSLAEASRAADLIVAGGSPRSEADPYREASPAELAMQSGRPVLVAPAIARPFSGQRVVVAWKDTREARRALSDAMPFLEAAQAVLVLEVCDPDSVGDATLRTGDVAAALGLRGVAASAKVVQARSTAATCLLDEAATFGADLIIMGCYGHTRLGEWAFGGVTRDLLAQDDVFLLLSH